jgi:hypothetical protein
VVDRVHDARAAPGREKGENARARAEIEDNVAGADHARQGLGIALTRGASASIPSCARRLLKAPRFSTR